MFPLMIDLTGRLVVVVGGGGVGRRKVAAVRAAGACVRLVCLEPRPTDETDGEVEWRTAPYTAGDLASAALVFAAATPEVNRVVTADARAEGIWVMDASDPAAGDFHTPAVLRRGPIVIAVSTSGASPLLAARVRDRLDLLLDPAYTDWAALLAELRPVVLASTLDPARRHEVMGRLADEKWLARLREEGVEAVRLAMWRVVDG